MRSIAIDFIGKSFINVLEKLYDKPYTHELVNSRINPRLGTIATTIEIAKELRDTFSDFLLIIKNIKKTDRCLVHFFKNHNKETAE